MSDHGSYPPPGQPYGQPPVQPPPPGALPAGPPPPAWYPQPGQPPPGYPPQGYGYPQPGYPQPGYPPMMVAAHKPGAIPLRPLRLGDIYDAAFKIIRINPGATVGSSVLVTAVAMAIPLLVTGLLTAFIDFSLTTDDIQAGGDLARGAGSLLQGIGLIFVTGMVTHVASAAALGRKLTLGEAWGATRGRRWKLVGLTTVLSLGVLLYLALVVGVIVVIALVLPTPVDVLVAVLVGLAGLAGLVFGWVRLYYLAVPPLMLEGVGVFAAIGRGWQLTGGDFWRIFGIGLLTVTMAQIIGGIIAVPFGILGAVALFAIGDGNTALLAYLVASALAAVASSAFVAPFTAGVTAVQYLDQRIRKEGYDVELLSRAGLG